MSKKFFGLKIVALSILFGAAVSYAAWTEPTATPPDGNVPAPLNVGSDGQSKSGGLILNTGGAPNGLIVDKGNVGIGTANPTAKLEVVSPGDYTSIRIKNLESTPGIWELRSMQTPTNNNGLTIWGGSQGSEADRLVITKDSGNVGIGTTMPGEKLEVNGAIKFGADASVISKAPRVIHTEDPVSGCPPARAANTDLFTQTFTLSRSASVSINASMIRNYSGRADMYLYVDGTQKDQTLDYTPSLQWFDDNVHWAGTLAAGSHTVSLRGNIANIWGCGAPWGSIDTIIFE